MPSYPFERRLGAFPARRWPRGVPRLGAAARTAVRLRVGDREHELTPAGCGILEATVEAEPGEDYAYAISGIEFPDPASRWQPNGLRGRSRLLDASAFAWTDERLRGPRAARHRRSTSCTSARSPPRGRSRRRSRTCASCASWA